MQFNSNAVQLCIGVLFETLQNMHCRLPERVFNRRFSSEKSPTITVASFFLFLSTFSLIAYVSLYVKDSLLSKVLST